MERTPPKRSRWLAWPGAWFLLLVAVAGIVGGLGVFTFGYGKGASYLSNDPKGCVNCHVMEPYYESWQKSSHKHVATCNSCHLSHHWLGKWVTKTDNGFFHSLAFTTGNFHEPIQIKPRNRQVTQNACMDCHKGIVHQMATGAGTGEMISCVHCHSDVGHALNNPR